MPDEKSFPTIQPQYVMFALHQTGGTDDLKDANIGEAVSLTGNFEIGRSMQNSIIIGKLVALTLDDLHNGQRLATVQVAGICTFRVSDEPNLRPSVGDRIIGGQPGKIKQGVAERAWPGGTLGRGTVIDVNGNECKVILN